MRQPIPEFDQPAGKRLVPLEHKIRSFGVMQKERNALSQNDRMHEQAELVNQAMRDELPNQFAATDQPQVSLKILPHCSDDGFDLSLNMVNRPSSR